MNDQKTWQATPARHCLCVASHARSLSMSMMLRNTLIRLQNCVNRFFGAAPVFKLLPISSATPPPFDCDEMLAFSQYEQSGTACTSNERC
jgi:hypothetical protein